VAEWLKLNQRPIAKRLMICIPLFAVSIALLVWQIENPDGFNTIWQYFGWSNQALSVFTLWALTVYLVRNNKPFWITLIPALFMTTVCSTFLFVSKQAFGLPETIAYIIGFGCFCTAVVGFGIWYHNEVKSK
jgi:carbon starvation protein CstA